MPTPPRLAEALLARTLRHETWRDTTLGDLREEWTTIRQSTSPARASLWYWREVGTLLIDHVQHQRRARRRARLAHPVPGKDSPMRTLLTEARLAARALSRQPLVSIVVILTMALGLGVNAATFGMIDSLLLRPFTVPNLDRLVVLSENSAEQPFPQESVSPATYDDLRHQTTAVIPRMSTVSWGDVNMSGADQPERVQGSRVGAQYFAMLGIAPAEGRFFVDADERVGAERTVVISDGLWKRRFGGRPNVIGQTIRLDDETFTVIGRAPQDFDFPNGSDVWMPHILTPDDLTSRTARYLTVIGELAPGVTLEQAQAQVGTIYERLRSEHPDDLRGYDLVVRTFTNGMVDFGMPQVLLLFQAAALLLLVIAGTNIANLLLARGAERERELALRLAIGAGRGRVIRQMLVESAVLAMAAVPAALMVAWVALVLLRGLIPAELLRFIPGWETMSLTPRMAAVTAATALVASVVFGLIPAFQSSNLKLASSLKDGGRSSTAGAGRSRLRRALVVAEIAVALPLLVASGLAALGGYRMASGPQGFDPDGMVMLRMSLPESTYPDADHRRQFVDQLLEEGRRTPGISEVTTATVAPSTANNQRRRFIVDGVTTDPGDARSINYRAVSAGFFETLRIPIENGRGVEVGDRNGSQPVAVISRSLASLYWPDETPLGKRIKFSEDDADWTTIVGVSGNVLDDWFSSRNAPTVYVPAAQRPSSEVNLLARGTGSTADELSGLRAAIARVDSGLPAFDTKTVPDAIHLRTSGIRMVSRLMAAFGLLALLLSAAGIYSVMAHYVAQRRHEIGVRMALGATTRNVLELTVGQGLKLAGVGIVIGLGLGVALARVIENALFGVVAIEPALFAGITVALTLVAILATLLPARHAVSVDPAGALRD